jgi:DNA gyrase subunit A
MDEQTPLFEEEELIDSAVSADATDVINIEDEMKNSYIEYAMSVIVGRALPDVRDGLKPVHRRILYAMYDAGYVAGKPYKKCARIVGDVLGRYHPHGDSAVYDALVRLAQDFSLRYPLIDGQGNYGSVDGDNAAAMRYTEARMTKLAMSLLDDIEKETVSFVPNFDESLQEPTVLPTRLPTLLLNGSSGIAVGMATNIPPHNLVELVDGLCALIDNPDITVDELMEHIKGPDFPTAGIICGQEGIRQAYATGRGSITIRAKTKIEESKKRGKTAIIVNEIPYQVNKANLIIRIAELVQEKKIPDITDLRDESDRKGMRIYIELKRDANPDVVLNQLFKHTPLQNTFGVNMVALVAGIPRTLTLKEVLVHYIAHRHEVIVRRTQYDLRKAQERLHLLEGFRIALDSIDAVIALIRASMSTEEARQGLMSNFGLTEIQATAILEMRLQRLTGLERDKIENEYKEILLKIADFQDILSNEPRIYSIIKAEHRELSEKYGDARRSEIGGAVDAMNLEDLIPEESVAVLISQRGFVKRMPLSMFRNQQRGGRGVNSMTTRDEDQIAHLVVTSSHDHLLCFTNVGRVYKIRVFNIPEASKQSKGVSIAHFLSFEDGEYVTACIPIDNFESDEYLLMATLRGVVKKTEIAAYSHFKNKPIIALTLDEGDQLKWVRRTNSKKDVVMVTANGMVIRFGEDDVRPMGRVSRGVRGINIKKDDTLISMDVIDTEETNMHLLIITRFGYGKNIKVGDFKDQRRGGIGVRCLKFRKTVAGDRVTDAVIATKDQDMMAVTKSGTMCRQAIGSISVQKRESQGVRIVKLDPKDEIIAMSALDEEVDEPVSLPIDNA